MFDVINENLTHLSVDACISAAREYMTQFVACWEMSDSGSKKLKTEGFRMGVGPIPR
jgi:hypothetical protein